MKFKKYTEIENSYREKFVQQIIDEGYDKGDWIVLEKIHGSNLSIWLDKDEIKYAKRTMFLDSDFYNSDKVLFKYNDNFKSLFNYCCDFLHPDYIAIYGEIYGGSYFHKEVSRITDAMKIQKGVYYCPDNDWIAYDVCLFKEGKWVYMNYEKAVNLFKKFNIPHIPIKFKGSFQECLDYQDDFLSEIYKLHNLPPIENNICEGVVMKPLEACYVFSQSRAIFKKKNDKFKEIWKGKKKVCSVELSDLGNQVLKTLQDYVTENRYNNVISKIGQVTIKDFGKILGEMMKDILKDYEKDDKNFNSIEDKKEEKLIKKKLSKVVANLIKLKL